MGSLAGGRGGSLFWPPDGSMGPSDSWLAAARPSIRSSIPAPLSSAAAVSHFLFSSRPWRHRGLPGVGEVVGAPQEAGVFFLYHCPSLPTPIVLLKKVWTVKVNLRGTREFCTHPPAGFHSLSGRFPTPPMWDPGVSSGTPPSQPFLSAASSPPCLPTSSVLLSVSAALSLPHCPPPYSRGPASPGFLGVGRVVPCFKHVDSYTTHTHTCSPCPCLAPGSKAWGTEPH